MNKIERDSAFNSESIRKAMAEMKTDPAGAGKRFGHDVVNADFRSNRLCSFGIVSRDHCHVKSHGSQTLNRLRRTPLERIRDSN